MLKFKIIAKDPNKPLSDLAQKYWEIDSGGWFKHKVKDLRLEYGDPKERKIASAVLAECTAYLVSTCPSCGSIYDQPVSSRNSQEIGGKTPSKNCEPCQKEIDAKEEGRFLEYVHSEKEKLRQVHADDVAKGWNTPNPDFEMFMLKALTQQCSAYAGDLFAEGMEIELLENDAKKVALELVRSGLLIPTEESWMNSHHFYKNWGMYKVENDRNWTLCVNVRRDELAPFKDIVLGLPFKDEIKFKVYREDIARYLQSKMEYFRLRGALPEETVDQLTVATEKFSLGQVWSIANLGVRNSLHIIDSAKVGRGEGGRILAGEIKKLLRPLKNGNFIKPWDLDRPDWHKKDLLLRVWESLYDCTDQTKADSPQKEKTDEGKETHINQLSNDDQLYFAAKRFFEIGSSTQNELHLLLELEHKWHEGISLATALKNVVRLAETNII